MKTSIRPFRAQDLGRVLRLSEEPAPLSTGDLLNVDDAVDLINAGSSVAVVAEGTTGEVVGVAVGEASAVVGWVRKVAAPGIPGPSEIAAKPPDDLESRLVDRGARKLAVLVDDEEIDVDALVAASERFTPADIAFAARTAAHTAFEREHFDAVDHRATTEDFLAAIEVARPTVTEEKLERFREHAERYARY